MAVFDSRTTQGQAEDTLHQALLEAFEEYFTQAQEAILGPGSVTADATPGEPPSLDAWPGMGLWDDLVTKTVAPAIEAVFGVAFDAAARSDVLQQNRYRTAYKIGRASCREREGVSVDEGSVTTKREHTQEEQDYSRQD